jgi:hypothetical protein
VKPVLQALLLADRIYEDKSGKKIIAGTFNKLVFCRSAAGPQEMVDSSGVKRLIIPGGTSVGSPYAYISLTEVRGLVHCVLRYVDLGHDKPLFQCEFEIRCEDPLRTIEIVLPMPTLPMNPGAHALELLCDDEPLGAFRIIVEETPPQDQDQ